MSFGVKMASWEVRPLHLGWKVRPIGPGWSNACVVKSNSELPNCVHLAIWLKSTGEKVNVEHKKQPDGSSTAVGQ